MVIKRDFLRSQRRNRLPIVFLLLCVFLLSSCVLSLYELPLDSVSEFEETKHPEVAEYFKKLQCRPPEFKWEYQVIRTDLEEEIDIKRERAKEYIKNLDPNIIFASDLNSSDGFLVHKDKLEEYGLEFPITPDPAIEYGTKLSFIHLSDVQLHDERVYMFDKKLTKFFDKFVESFEYEKNMILHDKDYYLTLIETINFLHNQLKEQKPKFMIHTADAIDMGVMSELYEFIYITNMLQIPWYNVLGNHDYPIYGNLSSKEVGVIEPHIGFLPVTSKSNFINMHGNGLFYRPSNAPDDNTILTRSVYNGFDGRGKYYAGKTKFIEKLEVFPSDVIFGNHLKDKVRYDNYCNQLILDGVMSKEEKKELISLSDDKLYQRAIENLFKKGLLRERRKWPCTDCPGYYHFEALPPKDGNPGILCIILDTTTKNFEFSKGTLCSDKELEENCDKNNPPKQALWVKDILENYSQEENWMVLVFGHHRIGKKGQAGFFDNTYKYLEELFFNPNYNVIAYFCGHTHEHKIEYHQKNKDNFGFWEIVTDSILEYPKRGSLVTINHSKEKGWNITLQSFWPFFLDKLDINDSTPELLKNAKSCFDASKKDNDGKMQRKFRKLDRKHHDVILRFNYPKAKQGLL